MIDRQDTSFDRASMSVNEMGPTSCPARRSPRDRAATVPPIRLDCDTANLAAAYDDVGFRQFEHGRVLVGMLDLAGQRVLDVGCGTGLLGAWVADRVGPGGEVFGIDPLPLRVALAKAKHPRLQARVGRAEDLSAFASSSFDVLYMNSVLHWIPDQPRALAEAARVLHPSGRIAVNSADAQRPHEYHVLLAEVFADLGLRHRDPSTVCGNHRLDAESLAALLHGACFTDVQVSHHTFVDRVRDADELIRWCSASSFGNWLADLEPEQRVRLRDRLSARLDGLRSDDFVHLKRHHVFATARNGVSPRSAPLQLQSCSMQ